MGDLLTFPRPILLITRPLFLFVTHHSTASVAAMRVLSLGFLVVALVFQPAWAGTFQASSPQEAKQIKAKIQAAHFLSKATFGPNQATIDSLASRIAQVGYRRACEEWIDNQFAIPATSHRQRILDIFAADGESHTADNINVTRVRHQAWWDVALRSDDQLRQKFAWALSQIFVINDQGDNFNNNAADFSGSGAWLGPTNFYDEVLVNNSFGSYRDLLSDMTFSPVMGTFLSHLRNRKADIPNQRFPDENYAREIMQLFSIGLYVLEQDGRLKRTLDGELIPSYDNEEIKTLARLFTGFKNNNDNQNIYGPSNLNAQMEIWPPDHDNNLNYSEEPNAPAHKRLFGTTLPAIPATLTANDTQVVINEIEAGLDVLFNHESTAPFLSRLLIQRMVHSNPSRGYIRRVANSFKDNGSGQKGDFKAVIKAILLDPEVARGQRLIQKREPLRIEVHPRDIEYSRLREPVIRVTSLIRALNPSSDYANGYMMLRNIDGEFGQSAYRSPGVFNFYLPDYQPPGALIGLQPSRRNPNGAIFAPEFQVLTAVTANRAVNSIQSWIRNRYINSYLYAFNGVTYRNQIIFNLDADFELVRNPANLPQLIRKYDLLLCNGSLSPQTEQIISEAMTAHAPSTSDYHTEIRLEETLIGILTSADCAIEQ
jgi:uncharacterized protein (DUF1800 family)